MARQSRKGVHSQAADPQPNHSANASRNMLETDEDDEIEHSNLNAMEYLDLIISKNKDPKISKMLQVLKVKIPGDITSAIEADKRGRSLVIAGLPQSAESVKPSLRQKELEEKVEGILDVLKVECRPVELYRMGKLDTARPRLVKLVLPSKAHWLTALSNARLLRSSEFRDVFLRRSMTPEERRKEFELRQEARNRNSKAKRKEWVVYRGVLTNVKDLRSNPYQGNGYSVLAPQRV